MKKSFIFSSLCIAVLGSTVTSVQADTQRNMPTIERHEEKFSHSSGRGHQITTWESPFFSSSNILQPSSAKRAGMVESSLKRIDQVINQAITEKIMPGAVTFVARGGHVAKHDAYGYAALYKDGNLGKMDKPIQMRNDTIFDLASISKIFTSTAIMKLYEDGDIKLDNPVAEYIPEFAQNGKETVTVRQLLTHTSGFTAWIPLYTIGNSREERIQAVFQQPLQNAPGTTYTYSDLNMITLGAIVERLSGKRLDQFVKEQITGPLNMQDTMYNPPASLKKRIAATEFQKVPDRGLVWGEVHDENAWSLDGVAGHAGVFSTAKDLSVLAQVFLNKGQYQGKRILKPETVKLLLENQNQAFPGDDHGLGWELGQGWYMDALSDSTSFGHTGYTGTSIVINPKQKTVAILLTNRVHPTRNTVSTNQTRRLFARQVADAIPVSIPGKGPALFSGYGDHLSRILETDLSFTKNTTLSFKTWYSTEENADYGQVDIYKEGKWQKIMTYTGSSDGWKKQKLSIPKDAEKLRFTYKTDSSVNGRGWYIQDVKVGGKRLSFQINQWTLRNY